MFGKGPVEEASSDSPLVSYDIRYLGGLAELPKSKVGKIKLGVFVNRFQLTPTLNSVGSRGSIGFWKDLQIPFAAVRSFDLVDRQVSGIEAFTSGLNYEYRQKNNLHITFVRGGHEVVLRLEMTSGRTVMGQAKKCLELQDRLRVHGVYEKFGATEDGRPDGPAVDILDQVARLATLRDSGALTAEEFDTKKTDLLSRL